MSETKLDIRTIKNGEIIEKLNDAMNHRVIPNQMCLDTDWKAKRKVTLELIFSTNEDRNFGDMDYRILCSLPTDLKGNTKISSGLNSNGEVIAAEWKNPQLNLNLKYDDENVIPISREVRNA